MNRNVEIKATVTNIDAVRRRAQEMADGDPEILEQEDTFFLCAHGRLKLRRLAESEGQLIFYDRPDSVEPSECQYVVYPTAAPGALLELLCRAHEKRGVVRKRRTVYRVGQTRVHLDEVDGLGEFVELEVVLEPQQSVSAGVAIAKDMMDRLGIAQRQLVERAYIDLLQ